MTPTGLAETSIQTPAQTARLAPLIGVVFVALVAVGSFLPGSVPASNAAGTTVITYAKAHQTSLQVSAVILGISVFIGLFFYGQLRHLLRQSPAAEQLASISFGGAVLFAAGGAVTAGISLTLADSPGTLTAASAQTLSLLSRDLATPLFVGLGVLMLAAGLAIVRSRILPVWLGWSGLVLGIVAAFPLGFIAVLAGCLWTLAASITMARTTRANA
jgi:hypothetical protein